MAFNIGLTITAQNNSGRALSKLNRDLEKTEKNTRRTTKALKGLRLALGLIAVGVLVNFSKQLVQIIGNLQLMFIRLASVEGGAKKAKATFDRLFKTFGTSPFSIDAVTDSLVRLRAAGVEGELAFRAIEAGADAIAAFGGTSEELKRFSIGLQQVAGKGVLSMEELRQQIGEALPVAMRVFATETGRSISEVISEVEKGKISATEFIRELTGGLEKEFGGFAAGLGNTVLGSIQGAFSRIKEALFQFSNSNTDVAARIAATFQNVGKAAAEFIKNLTQEDVNRFFNAFATGIEVLKGVVQAIIIVSKAVLSFVGLIGEIKGIATAATIGTLGIIGFMLFGPAGAAAGVGTGLLAVLGLMDKVEGKAKQAQTRATGSLRQRQNETRFEEENDFPAQLSKVEDAQNGAAKGAANFIKGLVATDEQVKKVQDSLDGFINRTNKQRDAIQGLNKTSIAGRRELEGLGERIQASVAGASTFPFVKTAETNLNRLSKIMEKFSGDRKRLAELSEAKILSPNEKEEFAALTREFTKIDALAVKVKGTIEQFKTVEFEKALAKANDRAGEVLAKFDKMTNTSTELEEGTRAIGEKFRDIRVDLEKQLERQLALNSVREIDKNLIEEIKKRLESITAEEQKQIDRLKSQIALREKILGIETKINELQTNQKITELQREGRGALQNIFASDFSDQAADRRNELQQNILRTTQKIAELQDKIDDPRTSQASREAFEQQAAAAKRLIAAQQEALQSTTASGLAARELWLSVGDAIENGATNALLGLVQGTKTWKDVANDAFASIQQAAAKFLVELVKIQLQQTINNALSQQGGGGSGGGGFFGLLSSFAGSFFANGGAFSGSVKPFANGDIIRGPTMFGLAGEEGEEAIMPLTRVGGKLGVQSVGGGGDSFSIQISAIDAQNGTEFLRKNAPTIINTMRQANNLNRGTGKVR